MTKFTTADLILLQSGPFCIWTFHRGNSVQAQPPLVKSTNKLGQLAPFIWSVDD